MFSPLLSLAADMGPSVSPEAFKQAGDADDTKALIAALATCKAIELSANHTYTVSAPLPICPGGHQTVFGHGPSSKIVLPADYKVSQNAGCRAATDSATWTPIFYNPNCGGAVRQPSDSEIEYADFAIDARAVTLRPSALIAIFARGVRHLYVHGVICYGFADCVAALGSVDARVADSISYDTVNAGFDFWDSPLDAAVTNSVTYCNGPTPGRFGFLFNASDTTSTHDGTAANYYSLNNKSLGCGLALYIDPLTAGGSIETIKVIGLLADGLGLSPKGGIEIAGHVTGGEVVAPVLRGLKGGNAIRIDRGYAGGYPDHIDVLSPQIIDMSSSAPPIYMHGNNTNRLTGASFAGSLSYPYAIDTDQTGILIEGKFPAGSSGLADIHGTFPQIENADDGEVTASSCGASAAASGTSTKGGVTPGTSSTKRCTVNFPAGKWAYPPTCVVAPQAAGHDDIAVRGTTTAALTITSSAAMDGVAISFVCVQRGTP